MHLVLSLRSYSYNFIIINIGYRLALHFDHITRLLCEVHVINSVGLIVVPDTRVVLVVILLVHGEYSRLTIFSNPLFEFLLNAKKIGTSQVGSHT